MRAVNLLPRDAGRVRRRPKPAPVVAVVGSAVVALAAGAAHLTFDSSLSAKRAELAAVETALAVTPRPEAASPVDDAAAELAALRAPRVTALAAALGQRASLDRVLRRFSLVLPSDVWLQSLTVKTPVAPVADAVGPQAAAQAAPVVAAAPTFSIVGRTYSYESLARLLSRLGALPDLADVQLRSSQRVPNMKQRVVEFTIEAVVRADGASS